MNLEIRESQKQTKRIEIHQSQTMNSWTRRSKLLSSNRSAKMIEGTKECKRFLYKEAAWQSGQRVGFESRYGHLLDSLSVVPSSNSRPRL